ncbi:MAG: glycoside hydrolase family 25 protein [Ktedonobacteraceae bacterium]
MAAQRYVDISVFQGAVNWPLYRTWSNLAAMKATEGTSFTDPRYFTNKVGAEAAGVRMIPYHYARPDLNSPQAEAAWFFQVARNTPDLFLMLDDEQQTAASTAAWAYEWLSRCEQLFGQTPAVYASDSYIRAHLQDRSLVHFPLILANWTFDSAARPSCPPPWTSYIAVQYTDRATNIPGIAGPVDADIFLGETLHMQTYTPQSADFSAYFTANDADHWTCKNGHVIQYAHKNFYASLSMDGQSLPIAGLPLSNEIYLTINGKQVVLMIYERFGVYYDVAHVKDNQPGTGVFSICHLTDLDFLKNVSGLTLPAAPVDTSIVESDIHAMIDALAPLGAKALVDLSKLKG